jgi:branched-chain amino acid transport system substrate-binding protein
MITRTLAALALAGSAAAGCGQNASRPSSALPPAHPIADPACSSVTYGGPGKPQLLVASITSLQGEYADHGIQTSQALKLRLAQRRWRAGPYRVGLQICDETTAGSDFSDPAKCRRLARVFARNRSVVAVIGPEFSGCAAQMLPILNKAPGGPLAAISASTTYLGLTRGGPGVAKGEPRTYFPTGTRSFVRIVPADDVQGAAAAIYARSKGARRAAALNDGDPYGIGLAEAFATAAGRVELTMTRSLRWNPKANNYEALAARIARSRPDAVFLGGYAFDNAPRLVKDLRAALPKAQLIGPDGMNQPAAMVEGAGSAAEGFAATIAVEPASELPPRGRTFAEQFRQRYGQYPCCFSLENAEAEALALEAIERGHGDRAQIAPALIGSGMRNGLRGAFAIDRYGDTSLTRMGVYRITGGKAHFDSSVSPSAGLLRRR